MTTPTPPTHHSKLLSTEESGQLNQLRAHRRAHRRALLNDLPTKAAAPPEHFAASPPTRGQRLADGVAATIGSWRFIIFQSTAIVLWISGNVWFGAGAWDPYPFILLNLLLSFQAAYTAPAIMMSQNRQETRDRARAEHDYQINLKAELEIRHLHEKLDHLLNHQWERLLQIQEVQVDLLAELRRPK